MAVQIFLFCILQMHTFFELIDECKRNRNVFVFSPHWEVVGCQETNEILSENTSTEQATFFLRKILRNKIPEHVEFLEGVVSLVRINCTILHQCWVCPVCPVSAGFFLFMPKKSEVVTLAPTHFHRRHFLAFHA